MRHSITVSYLKVTLVCRPGMLPLDLVPMEDKGDDPILHIEIERGIQAVARLGQKNYRKMVRTIQEHGAENVTVLLNGELHGPALPGAFHIIASASLQTTVKNPAPTVAPAARELAPAQ
jgi:hypothetical protein